MVNRTASIGLAVALAPLGVLAQTGQPAASASAAAAIPRTGAGAGSNAARTRRRGTLNRRRARATADHAHRVRATPNRSQAGEERVSEQGFARGREQGA